MDLNFINKDFKEYMKAISKDMRKRVLQNIAEKTDIRTSLRQIGEDATIPLIRLSKDEIRKHERGLQNLSKSKNDNKKLTKYLDARQDNSVSSTSSLEDYKSYYSSMKKEETNISSSKLAANLANTRFDEQSSSKEKIDCFKKNRTEENNKNKLYSTKETSTNVFPNKENLKLTLINLFGEEDTPEIKIPDHKKNTSSADMKASTIKKILEAKNINKDKTSETKRKNSLEENSSRSETKERRTMLTDVPNTPITPRKRGRPPKNPLTTPKPAAITERRNAETERPKKEEKPLKSKKNVSELWKKTVKEYNIVKKIEYKRKSTTVPNRSISMEESQHKSSKDRDNGSDNHDRSRSSSPVIFKRHFVSDSSSCRPSPVLESCSSSDSISSIGTPDTSTNHKRRKSTSTDISSTSSGKKSPTESSDASKTKIKHSTGVEKSSDTKKASSSSKESSKVSSESELQRRKSVSADRPSNINCNSVEAGRKTPSIVRQSSKSSDGGELKRRKSVCADKPLTEAGRKTPSISRQSFKSSSDGGELKRKKSICADRSSSNTTEEGRKTPGLSRQSSKSSSDGGELKRSKSVCADRSSNNCNTIEAGRKTPSLSRQSSKLSSDGGEPKRRKSTNCNATEAGRKTPSLSRKSSKSSSDGGELKRRKSTCADRPSNNTIKTPSSRPQSLNVSSEGDKARKTSKDVREAEKKIIDKSKRRQSVCSDLSVISSTNEEGCGTPTILRSLNLSSNKANKVKRSKSMCVETPSEDIESSLDSSNKSSGSKRDSSISRNIRRKSVSVDTSLDRVTPESSNVSSELQTRELSTEQAKSSNTVSSTCNTSLERRKSTSKEDISRTPTRKASESESSNDYETVKRRIFSDKQKYTIPKRSTPEDTSSRLERTEDSVEEELEQIFKASTPKRSSDRPRSRNRKRSLSRSVTPEDDSKRRRTVTPKLNDSFINYGDLVEQMKTTPTKKKNIEFVAPLATSTTEFSKPAYGEDDMTYDSVLVIDENNPNRLLIRRRSLQDIEETTARTINRRHSFHSEDPLKLELIDDSEILKKPQKVSQRRKSIHEINFVEEPTVKRSNSEENLAEDNLPETNLAEGNSSEDTPPVPVKIDIQNIDIDKLFPTNSDENIITLEVSSEDKEGRQDKDPKEEIVPIEIISSPEASPKPDLTASEELNTTELFSKLPDEDKPIFDANIPIDISSDSSETSTETVRMSNEHTSRLSVDSAISVDNEETNDSLIVANTKKTKVSSQTTDRAVETTKENFISLLYIYDQYYKWTKKVESDIIRGRDPNIAIKELYFNKRHDNDLRRMYQKLTQVRVAHFSLIVFFDKLIKVLKTEFKTDKEISEIVIINYLRRVAWVLVENFTSPSDEKSLFNCITSYTSVEYLLSYKTYLTSKATDLDKKMIKIFSEFSYKNDRTPIGEALAAEGPSKKTTKTVRKPSTSGTQNSSHLNKPSTSGTQNLSLPMIHNQDKSPVKPTAPQKRKGRPPKKVIHDVTNSLPIIKPVPITKPITKRKPTATSTATSSATYDATSSATYDATSCATYDATSSATYDATSAAPDKSPILNLESIDQTKSYLNTTTPSQMIQDLSHIIQELNQSEHNESSSASSTEVTRKSLTAFEVTLKMPEPVPPPKPQQPSVIVTSPIWRPPALIANQSTAQSTAQSTTQSTAQSTVQSTAQSIVQSTAQSTAQSTVQSTAQSTVQFTAQSIVQSTAQSTAQSTVQSTAQFTAQSIVQSTAQTSSQEEPSNNKGIKILDIQVTKAQDPPKYLKLVDQNSLRIPPKPTKDCNQNVAHNKPNVSNNSSDTVSAENPFSLDSERVLQYLLSNNTNPRVLTTDGTITNQEPKKPSQKPPVSLVQATVAPTKRPYKKRSPQAPKDPSPNQNPPNKLPLIQPKPSQQMPLLVPRSVIHNIQHNVTQSMSHVAQTNPSISQAHTVPLQYHYSTMAQPNSAITVLQNMANNMPHMRQNMPQYLIQNMPQPSTSIPHSMAQPTGQMVQTMARPIAPQPAQTITQSVTSIPHSMAQPTNQRMAQTMVQPANQRVAQTVVQPMGRSVQTMPRNMAQIPSSIPQNISQPVGYNRAQTISQSMPQGMEQNIPQMAQIPRGMPPPYNLQQAQNTAQYYHHMTQNYQRFAQTLSNNSEMHYRPVPNMQEYYTNVTNNYTVNNMQYNNCLRVQNMQPRTFQEEYEQMAQKIAENKYEKPAKINRYRVQPRERDPKPRPVQELSSGHYQPIPAPKNNPQGVTVSSTPESNVGQQRYDVNNLVISSRSSQHLSRSIQDLQGQYQPLPAPKNTSQGVAVPSTTESTIIGQQLYEQKNLVFTQNNSELVRRPIQELQGQYQPLPAPKNTPQGVAVPSTTESTIGQQLYDQNNLVFTQNNPELVRRPIQELQGQYQQLPAPKNSPQGVAVLSTSESTIGQQLYDQNNLVFTQNTSEHVRRPIQQLQGQYQPLPASKNTPQGVAVLSTSESTIGQQLYDQNNLVFTQNTSEHVRRPIQQLQGQYQPLPASKNTLQGVAVPSTSESTIGQQLYDQNNLVTTQTTSEHGRRPIQELQGQYQPLPAPKNTPQGIAVPSTSESTIGQQLYDQNKLVITRNTSQSLLRPIQELQGQYQPLPASKNTPQGVSKPCTTESNVEQQSYDVNTFIISPRTSQNLPESLQEPTVHQVPNQAPQTESAPQDKALEDTSQDVHNPLALRNFSRDSGYLSPSDIIMQPDADVICERCMEPSNLMCSGCHTFYCSRECQQLAWPEHEKKCYPFSQND